MKENKRKCVKCGSSPADDSETTLFRFPKPGSRNIARCELWAKYCFPDKPWNSVSFQAKLHSEHRMLCHRHFKDKAFVDFSLKKLRRFASPDVEEETTMPFLEIGQNSRVDQLSQQQQPFLDTTNSPGPSGISGPSSLHRQSDVEVEPVPSGVPGPSGLAQNSAIPIRENRNCDQTAYIKCRKYLKKICQLRKQVKYFKNQKYLLALNANNSIRKLSDRISPTFALLLQSQIKNFKKSARGRRWTSEDKITALRLYKRSPTCYRLLRRMFCLPAPSTLKTILKKCNFKVGINDEIFLIIKKFISKYQDIDNEFVLMFDEMSLKKHLHYNIKDDNIEGYQDHGSQGRSSQPVSYALVFMVAGIRKKIKQPIAYYLSGASVTADRLTVLIKEVLKKCHENGINIASTVCDMDGVNRRALTLLGATASKPFFEYQNKEISTLFDAPHLIKCFRNLFLKYDIKCNVDITVDVTSAQRKKGAGLASWSHIRQFYESDNANNNFVFAPSLKQEHLNPNTKQKMKVKLAVQVLSHTVAAGMFAKISQGELTQDAVVTADLISKMDKLFDTLNSDSADLRRGKPYATNIKASSPHLRFIKEMKAFIQNIEFVGAARSPPSQEGWQWTLNGVERLWQILQKKHKDLKSLATRRLQQDPLENLFGCIRGNCGANCNPTSGQFVAGLKTAILSNLSHISSGNNCEVDENDAIIDNFKTFLKEKNQHADSEEETISSVTTWPQLGDGDMNMFDECGGETQACTYVCGYIIRKFKRNCQVCMPIFTTTERTSMHIFTKFKEYVDSKEVLVYANKDFVLCVEQCATAANIFLENNAYKEQLLKELIIFLKDQINFDFLNNCTEHKDCNFNYIVKTVALIIIKRFCILKNRTFAQFSSKIALKKKINILKHQ